MSLLNIQAREGTAKDINEFLEKGQSKILSIALIHENLYKTENLDKVNFQDYIENLISSINSTFDDKYKNIINVVRVMNASFDIQTSIPLGLIINELYYNILKHAFPDKKEGHVTIELVAKADHAYQLTISDDGVGMKSIPNGKKTLGLELVNLLVEQLNGKIIIESDNDKGTTFIIDFKEVLN